MKKSHIFILILIALAIVSLLVFSVDFSTYDTLESSKNKPGKFVHVIAKLDKSKPIEYDPIKNPNYLTFYATDTMGKESVKIVYHNSKPTDLEKSERLVLKGKMEKEYFDCNNILLKCPSKYKDDKKTLEKNISNQVTSQL
jgi:cytochrome c-type biogenesis protein CcmE